MAKTLSFENLLATVKQRKLAPVYMISGAEGFFADRIADEFLSIMPDDIAQFDQNVLYGPQSSGDAVVDCCRRYPMMGDLQLVVLKEAQGMRPEQLDRIANYVKIASLPTVLVIIFRGDKPKGAALTAAIKKNDNAVTFEAPRIYESNVGKFITEFVNGAGLNIQPKALSMLSEYVGTDLSRLYNEVRKLIDILGNGATVTPEAVEQHIGISKEYNGFELVEALAVKDTEKAFRIVSYCSANPKAMPAVVISTLLFNFFSNVLITYSKRGASEHDVMQMLGLKWPMQARSYMNARRNYNASQCIEIIGAIRRFDAAIKGVSSRRPDSELLHELIFRIITAPGQLFAKY